MSTLDPWFVFLISYNYAAMALHRFFALMGRLGSQGSQKGAFGHFSLCPQALLRRKTDRATQMSALLRRQVHSKAQGCPGELTLDFGPLHIILLGRISRGIFKARPCPCHAKLISDADAEGPVSNSETPTSEGNLSGNGAFNAGGGLKYELGAT